MEVARIAKVSLRQLQWWDERKVVSPRQEGHKRWYATDAVVRVCVIAELRRKGVPLQVIRRSQRFIECELNGFPAKLFQGGERELYLITGGKDNMMESDPARILEALSYAASPMLVVSVSRIMRKVHGTKPGS